MLKHDVWGIVLSAGVGIITGMIYFAGKAAGGSEAYAECANMITDAVKEVYEESK